MDAKDTKYAKHAEVGHDLTGKAPSYLKDALTRQFAFPEISTLTENMVRVGTSALLHNDKKTAHLKVGRLVECKMLAVIVVETRPPESSQRYLSSEFKEFFMIVDLDKSVRDFEVENCHVLRKGSYVNRYFKDDNVKYFTEIRGDQIPNEIFDFAHIERERQSNALATFSYMKVFKFQASGKVNGVKLPMANVFYINRLDGGFDYVILDSVSETLRKELYREEKECCQIL